MTALRRGQQRCVPGSLRVAERRSTTRVTARPCAARGRTGPDGGWSRLISQAVGDPLGLGDRVEPGRVRPGHEDQRAARHERLAKRRRHLVGKPGSPSTGAGRRRSRS